MREDFQFAAKADAENPAIPSIGEYRYICVKQYTVFIREEQ
jgi:hypothetical protein